MPVQLAFRARLPNRPGELAKVARQLADAGVNIQALVGEGIGEEGVVEFLVNDTATASRVLQASAATFQRVPVVLSSIADRPGSLARVAETLGTAGINIDSIYVVPGKGDVVQIAVGCSDPERADQLLSELSWD